MSPSSPLFHVPPYLAGARGEGFPTFLRSRGRPFHEALGFISLLADNQLGGQGQKA